MSGLLPTSMHGLDFGLDLSLLWHDDDGTYPLIVHIKAAQMPTALPTFHLSREASPD